jgi:tRNA A37 N6-isopentenylltransferase MiaA
MLLAPIFLMGATACGKTELSLSIAKTLDAEIIII